MCCPWGGGKEIGMWNAQAAMPAPGHYAVVACQPQQQMDELTRLREANAHLVHLGAMREDQLKKYESFEAANVVVRNKLSDTVLEKTRSLEEAARIMTAMREELHTQQRLVKEAADAAKAKDQLYSAGLEEERAAAKEARSAANAANARVTELQRSVAALATDVASARKEAARLPALEDERARALQLVESTGLDAAKHKKDAAAAHKQMSDMYLQLGTAQAQCDAMLQKTQGLERDRSQLELDRASSESAREALERDRAHLEAAREALERERAQLDDARASLEEERASLERTRLSLEAGLASLGNGMAELERERACVADHAVAGQGAVTGDGAAGDVVGAPVAQPPKRQRKAAFPAAEPLIDRPQRRAKTEAKTRMMKC